MASRYMLQGHKPHIFASNHHRSLFKRWLGTACLQYQNNNQKNNNRYPHVVGRTDMST